MAARGVGDVSASVSRVAEGGLCAQGGVVLKEEAEWEEEHEGKSDENGAGKSLIVGSEAD